MERKWATNHISVGRGLVPTGAGKKESIRTKPVIIEVLSVGAGTRHFVMTYIFHLISQTLQPIYWHNDQWDLYDESVIPNCKESARNCMEGSHKAADSSLLPAPFWCRCCCQCWQKSNVKKQWILILSANIYVRAMTKELIPKSLNQRWRTFSVLV